MSRAHRDISRVIDEVVSDAELIGRVSAAEKSALKIAESAPKTAVAKNIRIAAEIVRNSSDDFTYADLWSLL